MRIQKLEVRNIGMVSHEVIHIDKPLNLFYGSYEVGKTTMVIKSVQTLFGGTFPDDIIKHGENDGEITLTCDEGLISRSFYINKAGKTVARPLVYTREGKPVPRAVEAIREMINPFLLDQDVLVRKNGVERERFFLEIFGVDTSDVDDQILSVSKKASQLRAEVRAVGSIDIAPVEQVDIASEKEKLEKVNSDYDNLKDSWDKDCKVVTDENTEAKISVSKREGSINSCHEKLKTLQVLTDNAKSEIEKYKSSILAFEEDINNNNAKKTEVMDWIKDHPAINHEDKSLPDAPEKPDTSELEEKISNAKAENVKYEAYLERVDQNKKLEAKKTDLKSKETEVAKLRKDKIAKLSSVTGESGISGLSFDENGKFMFNNTSADMLSTSQLMDLSSQLSKMLPNDLGIELIDRAESLGTSIFSYVDRAKSNETTILATIVGEKPADIPEEIGVFVVEDGKIK